MSKARVFVSFDFDNDKNLKELLVGQSRMDDSPFEIVDNSLKEAAPEKDWLKKAEDAISRSDILIVVLGPKTRYASGVKKEIQVARELGKRMFQIVKQEGNTDWAVPDGGKTYLWTWENLKKLLA